jgi:hypothetical protein
VNMPILGQVDNGILHHQAIRAIHGWIESPEKFRYICVFHPTKPYLFKLIYHFSRLDLSRAPVGCCGFLAEIVYGADDLTEGLCAPSDPLDGVVLNESLAAEGVLTCHSAMWSAFPQPVQSNLS